ncbi:MAG: L-2-hydroxyglutarate oxidase [Paracoccus sp. (in: a-proteobacteria)]|uniref:L-2-hydroxyglutarate oxidase n=1 Tax=Paracoccus sp. TaxID=267 RepID=UPI0026DFF3B1|nr:L-2-hydroxyglutarate oxidase [Paracoccus sp. (in: a-proteobacteria)]MDO5630266.1 L-2-hydroxyglutarate oxidase [Paracoccus sp. (in: a-proteobacteria)]
MTHLHPDLVVVGGGILGLATAFEAQQRDPAARVLVLEQEHQLASHQTGRNSGVIHAGVYYPAGSLKARFCREGAEATRAFCDAEDIRHDTCGKLIVATTETEIPRMQALLERARANGIDIAPVSGDEARRLEPNIQVTAALISPATGITDFGAIARRMAERIVQAGGVIRSGVTVTGGTETAQDVRLTTSDGPLTAGRVVFCCGLWADRMARQFGACPETAPDFRIIPFRGEYFRILNQPPDLVRHLIYPVPDPERPFLGVHLTRKLDGGFTVGPNAVLVGARDGYSKIRLSPRDLTDALAFSGFWRMLWRNAGPAASELAGSLSRRLYLQKVRRYCPQIRLADLTPYRPGIRAQAVAADGRLIDDFLFARTPRTLHVCNAPSPAATSAFPIAAHILNQL